MQRIVQRRQLIHKRAISEDGLRFIARWEGFSATPYQDVAGIWTIGYGHVILPQERFTRLTMDEGLALLDHDADLAEYAVSKYINVSINQQQFDALVSFTFNVGSGALQSSTLCTLCNAGRLPHAANQLLRWNKSRNQKTGKLEVVSGLTNRRAAERRLFLNGIYQEA